MVVLEVSWWYSLHISYLTYRYITIGEKNKSEHSDRLDWKSEDSGSSSICSTSLKCAFELIR